MKGGCDLREGAGNGAKFKGFFRKKDALLGLELVGADLRVCPI